MLEERGRFALAVLLSDEGGDAVCRSGRRYLSRLYKPDVLAKVVQLDGVRQQLADAKALASRLESAAPMTPCTAGKLTVPSGPSKSLISRKLHVFLYPLNPNQ